MGRPNLSQMLEEREIERVYQENLARSRELARASLAHEHATRDSPITPPYSTRAPTYPSGSAAQAAQWSHRAQERVQRRTGMEPPLEWHVETPVTYQSYPQVDRFYSTTYPHTNYREGTEELFNAAAREALDNHLNQISAYRNSNVRENGPMAQSQWPPGPPGYYQQQTHAEQEEERLQREDLARRLDAAIDRRQQQLESSLTVYESRSA